MVRIAGKEIPNNKRLKYSLPYIYGIGISLAEKICNELNIDSTKKTDELTQEEIGKIEKYIDNNLKIENELRTEIQSNIKRLIEINCYRGIRHRKKLPVRAQRTRTNARTRKGPKKTVGSGKRKITKK
ncbi:MAG: 30S ribosomal protein S13 [Candidatus Parcubacteria bacterium]|nr:MAG: 30S ribosomal protein S13 [Candidatus Parcubacteria bacterium]